MTDHLFVLSLGDHRFCVITTTEETEWKDIELAIFRFFEKGVITLRQAEIYCSKAWLKFHLGMSDLLVKDLNR